MELCFYLPALRDSKNNAIFGTMFNSFFEQLRILNFKVHFTTNHTDLHGDILITNIGSGYEKTAAKAMHLFDGPVILYTYNANITFYKSFLLRWQKRILFAYNPDYASLNFKKYNSIGIPYLHLPLASDPSVFKPLARVQKKYDICFLGNAHSGFGRELYIKKLVDYARTANLDVFVAGSGWEKFGFPERIVKHGEETNLLYNQSKVCINIHNDRQYAGIDVEMDANNRLFDLAMAGCCQVSNGEKMIERYFSKEEVAAADDPDEWVALIDSLLYNEDKRLKMGLKAREKAIRSHTWEVRAAEFIDFINQTFPSYNFRDQRVGIIDKIFRRCDQYLMPPYLYKEIRIVRYILIRLGLYTQK